MSFSCGRGEPHLHGRPLPQRCVGRLATEALTTTSALSSIARRVAVPNRLLAAARGDRDIHESPQSKYCIAPSAAGKTQLRSVPPRPTVLAGVLRIDFVSKYPTAEHSRLSDSAARLADWKKWGPYLAERAWGNVREDYSASVRRLEPFPHDHARSRAHRWKTRTDWPVTATVFQKPLPCRSSLWIERDPYLGERLFGLTNEEGNHAAKTSRSTTTILTAGAEPRIHADALQVPASGISV